MVCVCSLWVSPALLLAVCTLVSVSITPVILWLLRIGLTWK